MYSATSPSSLRHCAAALRGHRCWLTALSLVCAGGLGTARAQAVPALSLTGDATSTIVYSLYPSPGIVEAFFSARDTAAPPPYGGNGAGATDASGQTVVMQLNYVDATSPLVPYPAGSAGCGLDCVQKLSGSGTLTVINPANNTTELTGKLGAIAGETDAIFALPGSSSAVIQIGFQAAGAAPEYLLLAGSTTAPVSACTLSQFGSCANAPYNGAQAQYFNSFSLDWTVTLSTTPYVPSVPELPTSVLLLAGAIMLRTTRGARHGS